ncbi:protein ENHANCED DISEASE RESISTANCE 2-like [Cynara cardunculus var. scolymus]|uniref:protein ENHANCED DISEASE RESISTANCE 2-like n=1 Tax=Cynara cardunculus var. scolymus TaxID=59895 RepID=UPI000D6274E9|nr:protein ENHANCED DISEASE RESISTANCE 2-like [Cynara cardunculus var. scolymus]
MDMSSENDEHRIMEGWLYLIRSNKFGFQYSRKRYYVLQNHDLKSFCSVSHSLHKGPVRSAVVNSCICVMDNGRKNIRGKVFFIFTLSGISSTSGCLKLGARNPEEAARWVEAFQKLSLKMNQNPEDILDCDKYEQQHSRSNNSGRVHDTNSVDYHLSLASITDPKTADLSSYWTIFGCHNGLRLFKEARNQEHQKKRNGYPALAAMSVIDGAPEAIFQILMSFGSSRSEWDFCFQKGSVIEIIDGHTDIVHKLLSDDWLPRGMKRRDLLLQRCWRREDNGTYTILYHSVLNKKCPPQKSYIRACLKSGGYVISPVYQSKQSVVRHMLDIDWKLWNSYLQKSSAQSLSVHMLGRLAALREFFKTNLRNYLSEFSLQEPKRKDLLHQSETSMRIAAQRNENGDSKEDAECTLLEVSSDRLGLVEMDDESDEYFDLPEPFVDDQSESSCAAGFPPEIYSQDTCYDKSCTPPSNILMNKLNEYTVHRKGCANLEEMAWENGVSCNYILTLPKDPTGNLPNSWSVPEPSLFQIRGETYFQNRKKITAKSTLMQTVAVDWLRSDKREDHLAARPGSIVQNFAADGRPEFFFIVNFQVPGSTTYNVASYYMTSTPVKDLPLLEKFIEGDDAFRNSRFKLLPHITKGPWILKQSASRASLVGHMLKVNYIRGKNYIEIDIDVGSSTLARGLATTALSCFSNLISETAFVIQANTPDELPEHLYGASRLNHLDVSRAFWTNP